MLYTYVGILLRSHVGIKGIDIAYLSSVDVCIFHTVSLCVSILDRSASVNSMDLSAKRFKKESKSPNDIFISLLDSDGDDSGSGSDGDDIAKDESDVQNSDKNDSHGIDAQHMVSTTPVGEITDLISSEDVSSLWFVREHWQHQIVLAGHQLGTDTLLLQVGEPPGNESVKLVVYKWEADQDGEESVRLVSRFPLPIQVAGVREEPGFVPATLPFPLSIVGHQSGSQIGRLVPSNTISSSFYQQLFGPELALVKVPILLLGAPSGEVLYAPVTNMFAGGGGGRSCNIFSGPLCCLSQVVKGIHPVSSHRSDICDGLVIIGGRGKVLICIEDRGDEKGTLSPKIESLHVGFTVLSSCLLPPCLLVISGMKYVKIVDLKPALVSLGGRDRSVVLQCLHKTFYRASRLEVGEIIRIESVNHTTPEDRSCVSFDFDGGLSVIDISDKQLGENQLYSPATSSTMTVKERIAAKMAKLRRLESEGENATERLHKVEGYIRDVNMALHTVHLLTTGKETAFKVEQVTVLETGQSGSCCLKVSLAYGGQLKLGAGWSLVLSATAEGTRQLHVIQLPVMHHSACSDGSNGDGAAYSSVSSLEGMSPGSLCHCYLTLPVRDAIQPLVLTCTLRYDTTEASQYLGREQRADVSGVLLKKSLSVLDFMQPVPANVHISSSQPTKSHTTGPKPSSASGNETEARAISISRETVYKCVGSTGNHDSKTLLHHFMHVLIGRHNSNVPLESVGKDDVWLRLVLSDGSVILLSAKCALGKRQDSIECVCKSPSYNVLMAGTDAVIDRIVSVCGVCGVVWCVVCVCVVMLVGQR